MLKITQLQKRYGKKLILEINSLQNWQCIHWLRGTNGSGKSTFLKIAGGLIPFNGKIELDDIDLKKDQVGYRRLWAMRKPSHFILSL